MYVCYSDHILIPGWLCLYVAVLNLHDPIFMQFYSADDMSIYMVYIRILLI